MYHADSGLNPVAHGAHLRGSASTRVAPIVYFLGLTSLLTDISAEMVASVLPIYLLTVLRLSPFEYGLLDGLYHGVTALARLGAAYVADRLHRHKSVAFAGYLLSALSRCGLLVAGVAGWASVAAVLLADRIGKGIRTAPRDAMIAASATPHSFGAAFGVHRALDAVGAIAGPLLAAGILWWYPGGFTHVFSVSIVFAVLGLVTLAIWVKPETRPRQTSHAPAVDMRTTLAALRNRRFLLLGGAATLLSLFTLTDNMIYAGLHRRLDLAPAHLPLLFVATATVFMCLAIPVGRLADRIGHLPVFLSGYLLLAMVYCLFALQPALGKGEALLYVGLLGIYYAATDGVISALAARLLPESVRTTGIAVLATTISLGRMGSSILFGALWQDIGHEQAVGWFGAAMLFSLILTTAIAVKLSASATPAAT